MAPYCRVIKSAKNASAPTLFSNLQLVDGELILDIDGTVPTQPVLQHVGISAWPGELVYVAESGSTFMIVMPSGC